MNKKNITVFATVLISISLLAIVNIARTMNAPKLKEDPRLLDPTVESSIVKEVPSRDMQFSGTIQARVESDMGFRVGGKVIHRFVDKGQNVKQGDALMSLDPEDYNLSLVAADQQVMANKAISWQANADQQRVSKVVGIGATSASNFDVVTAKAEATTAQRIAAQAQAALAANAKRYTTLYAQADGVVVDTLAEPGQVVNAGQVVIKLALNEAREAVVNLPETVHPNIGSTATAYLFDDETYAIPAHLRQIAAQADPVTRTFEARFKLDDSTVNALLGSSVTLKLPVAVKWQTVPIEALLNRGNGYGVWVINPKSSRVGFCPVKLEQVTEDQALISRGINQGESVVASGAHLLYEGEKVNAIKQEVILP